MFFLPADTLFVRFKEFVTSGSSNNDTGKVFGSLETKYKYADYGKQTSKQLEHLTAGQENLHMTLIRFN